jgi:4'-phosphopantetheinyl transferase
MGFDTGRRAVNPPPNDIHLWLAFDAEIGGESGHADYRSLLTAEEKVRETRFAFACDRRRFLVTRALVRTALSQYAPLAPSAWLFTTGPYGRPQIANAGVRGLEFNVSHSDGLIVLAIGRDRELGVDVEHLDGRQPSLDVARRFFAPTEAADVAALPHARRMKRFFEYWTLKESYIKARSRGLSIPLRQFSFRFCGDQRVTLETDAALADDPRRWRFWQFQPHSHYLLALCAQKTGSEDLKVFTVRQILPSLTGESLGDFTLTVN